MRWPQLPPLVLAFSQHEANVAKHVRCLHIHEHGEIVLDILLGRLRHGLEVALGLWRERRHVQSFPSPAPCDNLALDQIYLRLSFCASRPLQLEVTAEK